MEFFNDVGADPLKPSLFELLAQEQLRDLLQPALKYVLAVLWHRVHRTQMVYSVPLGLCSTLPTLPFAHCKPSRRVLCSYYAYGRKTLSAEAQCVLFDVALLGSL